MTAANFTAQDLAATPLAFVLLGLFLVIPGYVLGALTDVFEFHRRSLPARCAIALCLSVAVVPILVYFNWRYLPAAPWALCAASWCAFAVIAVRRTHWRALPRRPFSKERKLVLAIVAGWLVLGTLCLVDLQIGHRLYFHLASYDYTLRTAFTAAIARTGVPPLNPYYYPGHPAPLRYHYFWFMLCALAERMGGTILTARIAVIAGTLWSGVALIAVLALSMQFFSREAAGNRDRKMLLAVALLGITGLDIVPNAVAFLLTHRFPASSEWWNEPVLSWANSVFWQPHSIAALVACVTGLLVARDGAQRPGRWPAMIGATLCGAAFAGACGLSIYVAAIFGVFLAAWTVTLFLRGRRRDAAVHCAAGVIVLLLAGGFLLSVSRGGSVAGPPIGFAIRPFYFVEVLVSSLGKGPHWHVAVADALTLPVNYFFEFGFFFLVAVRQWKKLRARKPWTDQDAFCVVMLVTSIVICSFFRSNAIANNDLGWRGIIAAQFVLLLWAAELWDNGLFPVGKKWRSAAGALLILGALPAVYDVTMLRLYPLLSDDLAIPRYRWLAPDHNLGARTYALRHMYQSLNTTLPKSAIVQQNPETAPGDLFYGLYADRQAAAESSSCGAVFGGPPAACPAMLAAIDPLFSAFAHLPIAQVEATCRDLSIDAVVVKDTDSVWKDPDAWVWKAQPVMANSYARAFLCKP